MNCRRCQEELIAYVEGLSDEPAALDIESHLADCPTCRDVLDDVRQLAACLAHDGQIAPDVSLDTPVMGRIIREQALQLRRIQMRRRIRLAQAGGTAVAALAIVVLVGLWLARPNTALSAAEVMAKGAEAVPETSTIYIRAEMRTSPSGNFAYVRADGRPVPIEVWKEFGGKARWRIEKPGRVIAMDGASTVMFIRPDRAVVRDRPSASAFDTDWLHRLASVRSKIGDELRTALAKGWELKVTHWENVAGAEKSTVVIEARTELKDDDYLRDKAIPRSNNRQVYHFDRESGRLEGYEVYLHANDGDVLIFKVTEIRYNQPINPSRFSIELPENVTLVGQPEVLSDNEKYARMTPKEMARAFFEACAQEDWEECGKFCMSLNDRTKKTLGGLEIVRIGEPFRAKTYVGWFVPYEIKFKHENGRVRKRDLSVRNDNAAKRYIVDGGI